MSTFVSSAAARAVDTTTDPRWIAIVNRDATTDGSFYYSVTTTGVYCRPSCPARHARPEHVQFHLTCEEAERAGFRPCKRCKPRPPARDATQTAHADSVAAHVDALDWAAITEGLDEYGNAVVPSLLTASECEALVRMYPDDRVFRSRVVMGRHGFGQGEYKYFSCPLPSIVQTLRTTLYAHLAPVANGWNASMNIDVRYPDDHASFAERCHAAGQSRPTPLLLQYRAGDFNCLHQDLYGEHVFPIQVAFLLSSPSTDFSGGEFVLTEQRPRMQSRVEVVPLRRGDGVAFAVHTRPVRGTCSIYRVNMRHGVSRLRSGMRHTMGIIFHDGK